uniref:Glucosylceramidase n=1 Tax=Panagrolaimus sp. PS1159 TaxID=55785 RepID=A0AC35FZP8_9BILA
MKALLGYFFSLLLLLLVTSAIAQRPCVQKKFPGARNNIVCVCNSTYCDDIPSVGTFQTNEAVI